MFKVQVRNLCSANSKTVKTFHVLFTSKNGKMYKHKQVDWPYDPTCDNDTYRMVLQLRKGAKAYLRNLIRALAVVTHGVNNEMKV